MYEKGYDEFINHSHVCILKKESKVDQLKYIKEMWEQDPKTYQEWKEWCIELDMLPSLFGTSDHPIHIDESKL